jgi:N-acetylmuramoyl-L-alanine amidase
MVHSTGANNPNLKRYVQPDKDGIGVNKNSNDWNHPGIDTCVHAFIGKLDDGSIATVQTLPWNMRAWHAGSAVGDRQITPISLLRFVRTALQTQIISTLYIQRL